MVILSSFVFSGGSSLIFLKCPDEITEIIKSVPIGNLSDGIIGGCQLVTGFLDPLPVQIIHWCLMSHLRKEPAEIFGRHGHRGRKLLQSQRVGVILFNKFQHLFQLQNTFVIFAVLCGIVQTVMITKNKTKKVVKLSKYNQLITGIFSH